MWYVDAGIEDTPEPIYTHCLVLSCLVLSCLIFSCRRADNGEELKFYAREAFVSRDGFTFLVAGTSIDIDNDRLTAFDPGQPG